MKKFAKLVFFGTEDFSIPSFHRLIEDGWDIAVIITKPDSRRGRGQKVTSPKIKAAAGSLPVYQPSSSSELLKLVKDLKPSYGVLVAYGKIIPGSVIDLFPGGIVNLHPSLLPKYRGPAPIEAAILNGDKETGLSLMQLTAKMDAGPVYAQKAIALTGKETKPELYDKLANQGAEFLADNIEPIVSGKLQPSPQDESLATYTRPLKKADGVIDWSKPAVQIEHEIRAFLGFPKSPASLKGHDVVVTGARVASGPADGALVQPCGQGYLEITKLISPNGRKISGQDFINGYF